MSLGEGIYRGLSGLASGIAQRRQSRADMEAQERASKALSAFLSSGGKITPGMDIGGLSMIPPAWLGYARDMNKPQDDKFASSPLGIFDRTTGAVTTPVPTKQQSDTSVSEWESYLAAAGGDHAKAIQLKTQAELERYGGKKDKEVSVRPDKTQVIQVDDGSGNVKYGSLQTTPNGTMKFVPTEVAAPKSQAQTRISSADRDYLTSADGLVKILDDIEKNYNEGYTGPVQGRVGGVQSVTTGNQPGEAAFRANVASIQNQLLKMRSGAAVTPSEFERILSEIPNVNDPDENFKQKLRLTRENIELLRSRRLQLQGQPQTPRFQIESIE